MRGYFRLCAGGAALALFAAGPVWGQTFTYSEDFNDLASMLKIGASHLPDNGAIPIGWRVRVYPNYFAENDEFPQVLTTDGTND